MGKTGGKKSSGKNIGTIFTGSRPLSPGPVTNRVKIPVSMTAVNSIFSEIIIDYDEVFG